MTEPTTIALEDPEIHIYDAINEVISYYVTGSLAVLGVFTNILSFIAMLQPEIRHKTTSAYLAALSLSDIVCLVFFTLRIWYNYTPYCHVNSYLRSAAITYSGLLIVAVSFERVIAVWLPLKASSWLTRKRSLIGIALMAVGCLAVYAPRTVYANTDNCSMNERYAKIHKREVLALYSSTPLILIILFNAAIIFKLNCGATSVDQSASQSKTDDIRRITWMVVIVAMSYMLLILPSVCFLFYRDQINNQIFGDPRLDKLINTLSFTLLVLNHALNFWLYVTVSSEFRQTIRKVICMMCYGVWCSAGDGVSTQPSTSASVVSNDPIAESQQV